LYYFWDYFCTSLRYWITEDFTITIDFLSSLADDERLFLDDLTAGYSKKGISKHTRNIPSIRQSLQQKAVEYL
jgi:hypothetical protein